MSSGGGKGGPSGTTTSTSTTQPWSVQQPFIEQGFNAAQNLYNQNPSGPPYYPGQSYAGPTQDWSNALASITNLGQNNPVTQQSVGTLTNLLSNQYLTNNPTNPTYGAIAATSPSTPYLSALNPYLSGQMLSAGNPYQSQLIDSILGAVTPGIQKQFVAGGSLGSPQAAYATSQGQTSALAQPLFQNYQTQEQLQQQAADLATKGLGQQQQYQLAGLAGLAGNYNQGVSDIIKGLALSPNIQGMQYTDPSQVVAAATAQQQQQQAQINDAIQRYNYGAQGPYMALNQYLGQIGGNYGGTTTANQPYFANPGANALGMLGSAVGLGNSLFGGGSAGGGLLGGLGSMFALL